MKYFVLLIGVLALASCGAPEQRKKTEYERMVERRYKESSAPPSERYIKESQGSVSVEGEDFHSRQERERQKEAEARDKERKAYSSRPGDY